MAAASNDSWVEGKEMRLHKQEGIQVMRKVAGKLGNERCRSVGGGGMLTSFIVNQNTFLNKKSLYSPEHLVPLIKAEIAKRMHVNYSEIIHLASSVCTK